MGAVGSGISDVATAVKDMMLFFVAYTVAVFVCGQWFGQMYAKGTEVFWYPLYLFMAVLVIKIIADVFVKPAKK